MIIGKKYIIFIELGKNVLKFTGTITSIGDKFVTFIDKFGKELHYNLKNIVSYEEIKDG